MIPRNQKWSFSHKFVSKQKLPDILYMRRFYDLVPFVQFKKREKHPEWSFTFSKVAVWSNLYTNGTNGTKSHQTSMLNLESKCEAPSTYVAYLILPKAFETPLRS